MSTDELVGEAVRPDQAAGGGVSTPARAAANTPTGVNHPLTRKRAKRPTENHEYAGMMRSLLRRYGQRVSAGDLEDLKGLAEFAADVEATLTESVHGLRERGFSWAEIGGALGISRQAAQQRFGDPAGTGARKVGGQPAHLR